MVSRNDSNSPTRFDFPSWGNYPKHQPKNAISYPWSNSKIDFDDAPYLAYGMGRSYGDSCLNKNGVIINSSQINHILEFDGDNGVVRCEAGVTFDDLLSVIVPQGWFLPVTPGTRYVTVAGALANDVHGKNHHAVGSFGNHVTAFELQRSNMQTLLCTSENENKQFFNATIGGLGLTGFVTWVEFRLKRIVNSYVTTSIKPFSSIDDFFELDEQYLDRHEYSVAWIDTTSRLSNLGRGLYFSGDHAKEHPVAYTNEHKSQRSLNLPVNFPRFTLNAFTVKAFNMLYFNTHKNTIGQTLAHYAPFFYPLDNIKNWNRMYGKRGFFQHQCVVPIYNGKEVIAEILKRVSDKGMASFLSVLKRFGNIPSVGMMSFPREGYTLALDFPNKGKRTLALLNDLDALVRSVNGAIYPAKDARMSADTFATSFPNLDNFKNYIDPAFSSSFWRRVTQQQEL
ncbi:Putative oxidoreductase [hydrothermal vent metagenome]|uniref:Oxidoreductase n=1 Tax=hydrothermal vent metagenome TaxID=652676 RepID=A0A3B1A7S7_9ZZZZ